jgi:hypothetical protein
MPLARHFRSIPDGSNPVVRFRGVRASIAVPGHRARLLVAAAMAVVAPLAQAQADVMARRPAAELLAACETVSTGPEDSPAATRCLAFVEGFLWGHGWAAWRQARDPYFCPPGEGPVAARSLVPTVVAHLRAHPERLDQPAHLMLFSALSIAYPCDGVPVEPPAGR